jgi:integrase
MGVIGRNPCEAVTPPRRERQAIQPLTLAEVKRLLDTARGERSFAFVHVAVSTGLRGGELLGLQWSDLDWDRRTLTVNRAMARVKAGSGDRKTVVVEQEPKTTSSRRVIPLSSETVKVLRQWRAQQADEHLKLGPAYRDGGYLFAEADGTLADSRTWNRRFVDLLKRAGLPHHRLHDTRHTAGTLLMALNVHPKIVQSVLGHSKVSVTLDLYSHASAELNRPAMEQLGALLEG